jgi:hypothetical protein
LGTGASENLLELLVTDRLLEETSPCRRTERNVEDIFNREEVDCLKELNSETKSCSTA